MEKLFPIYVSELHFSGILGSWGTYEMCPGPYGYVTSFALKAMSAQFIGVDDHAVTCKLESDHVHMYSKSVTFFM